MSKLTDRQREIVEIYMAAVGGDGNPEAGRAAVMTAMPDANRAEIIMALRRAAERELAEADQLER